jgi:hypothetical protein
MKTKYIINEWKKFLNENRIIPLSELVDIIRRNSSYSIVDVDQFTKFWNSNQFSSKYSQVIKNDLEKGEPIEHIVDAVTSHYNKVYQSAGPKIKSSIGDGSYTVDDLRKDLDAKVQSGSFNKLEVRQQCQYQNGKPVVGKYKDFDVIYSESDWIVIEPKTILGSIAWGHGKPDGSEETDQNRRVGWCTATSTENNMFPNYAGNLHMFYLIKTDYNKTKGYERRLCLSYVVEEGKAKLKKGDATVNANNSPIDISYINKFVSNNILNLIESLVSTRKETSFSEIYSKITLSQLTRQINQMKNQGVSQNVIENELTSYTKFSKNKEVVFYILKIKNDAKKDIASREDLFSLDPSGDLARQFINDKSKYVRENLAKNEGLYKLMLSDEFLAQLANDEDEYVRAALAKNKNLKKLDLTSEIDLIALLLQDESSTVRCGLAYRKDLLELDPSGDLFRNLVNDKNEYVRASFSYREDLKDIDPSGELLHQLANDEAATVRNVLATRKDLVELDPSGKIINQLANDEEEIVRSSLAYYSISIDLITRLLNDKSSVVRQSIASREDLKDIDSSGNIIKKLANDEDNDVLYELIYRPDLLELDPSGYVIKQLVKNSDRRIKQTILDNQSYYRFLNQSTNETILRSYIRLMLS